MSQITTAAPFRIVAGTTVTVDQRTIEDRAFFRKHDPIFRAIKDHRECTAIHTEAVEIEFASEGKVTKRAYAKLQETTSDAGTDMFAAARLLLQTQPTTMFGAIALLRYLEGLFGDDESGVDVNSFPDDIGGDWWHLVLVRTLASALIQVHAQVQP